MPEFEECRATHILNVHKHVDTWFFTKYSAHPYVGCAFGCEFCYGRGEKYLGGRDPDDFDRHIRIKINAAELLRRELSRKRPDVITCGDWQIPAEREYWLSCRMLEVVHDLAFPLFIVERSPLLVRDVDLLTAINERAWVGVAYSISTLDPAIKLAFEPRSPGIATRLEAMERLAKAGILVGTALMPVLPFLCDDDNRLEEVVIATKDHGGTFVLAGGLTMSGPQAERVTQVLDRQFPQLHPAYESLYAGGPSGTAHHIELCNRARALCLKHGLSDRMPRWIGPGRLGVDRWIAEQMFLRMWDLELEGASQRRIWAYRRAGWTVDELPTSIESLHEAQGIAGLVALPGVGQRLAGRIAGWLAERPPHGLGQLEQSYSPPAA